MCGSSKYANRFSPPGPQRCGCGWQKSVVYWATSSSLVFHHNSHTDNSSNPPTDHYQKVCTGTRPSEIFMLTFISQGTVCFIRHQLMISFWNSHELFYLSIVISWNFVNKFCTKLLLFHLNQLMYLNHYFASHSWSTLK